MPELPLRCEWERLAGEICRKKPGRHLLEAADVYPRIILGTHYHTGAARGFVFNQKTRQLGLFSLYLFHFFCGEIFGSYELDEIVCVDGFFL